MKIWPSYFAVYGVAVVLTLASMVYKNGWQSASALANWWPNAVFYRTMCTRRHDSSPAGLSLAIEEHFYLAAAFLVPFALSRGRLSTRAWFALSLAVLLVPAVFRSTANAANNTEAAYLQTHMRFDGLSLGVLGAYLHRFQPENFVRARRFAGWLRFLILPVVAVLVALAPAFTSQPFLRSLQHTLLTLSFFFIIVFCANQAAAAPLPANGSRARRLMIFLGTYSYTIYLAQVLSLFQITTIKKIVGMISPETDPALWTLLGFAFVGGSVLVGFVASHWVERPLLRYRDKWIPSQSIPKAAAIYTARRE